ncbi:MAG: hypothetical protein IKR89_08210 [Bacteroidaceae bacterium]|nr:hypothetical protein [Bacteroidaceae bacterium]
MSKIDNEIKKGTPRFKKGDALVEIAPHPLVFMEVNEVEGNAGNKDFCIVTWYSLDEKGINAQRRFPMVAVDGEFCNFEPISRNLLKEAKGLMRQYDAAVKQSAEKKETKSLLNEYTRKLTELLPDAAERLALAQQVEKEIVTNKWLDCEEDNYWVEDSEQGSKYITLVCVTSESYDDKNDKTITKQSIYLQDNCPYGWGTLVKSGAKYMVIEKPEK